MATWAIITLPELLPSVAATSSGGGSTGGGFRGLSLTGVGLEVMLTFLSLTNYRV